MTETGITENLEQAQQAWNTSLRHTAVSIGNLLSGSGDLLSRHCEIELVRGERSFSPMPTLKPFDGGVLIQCNLDAYDTWIEVMSEVTDLERRQIQQLYLGTAVSWAELTFIASAAKHDRESGLSGPSRTKAMQRAVSISKKFLSRDALFEHSDRLEEAGYVTGVKATIENLSEKQVIDINRMRYGLGVSLHVLDATEEVKHAIPVAFSDNLQAELHQHEETLIEFLDAFSRADRYADIAGDYEKIKKYSFPEFLFAGTMPMDISDAI